MSSFTNRLHRLFGAALLLIACLAHGAAPNRAPDFTALPRSAKILVMPADIELFSISAGGVVEPKAEWTEAAQRHVHAALQQRSSTLGLKTLELSEADADEHAEISALHAAVARSIAVHHFGQSSLALPTKNGKLDWSMGDAVAPLKARSNAEYSLFIWIRDSYASAERQATMVMMALLGVGLPGGSQQAYASLVDLSNGRIVWFNQLRRASGDLREAAKAAESIGTLLNDFPEAK